MPATPVPLGLYPWVVEKVGAGWHKCSGFLITNIHVLTSAHCLDNPWEYMDLTINFYNNEKYLSVKAKRFISHPKSAMNKKYDIAIVELASPINIKPPNINFYSYNCHDLLANILKPIAAGYAGNNILYAASLTWLQPCKIDDIFALYYQGYGQPGDSGGPLFFQNISNTHILGIHWGGAEASPGLELFTPLSLHQDFINTYIEFSRKSNGYHVSGTSFLTNNWINISVTSATSVANMVKILLFPALMLIL